MCKNFGGQTKYINVRNVKMTNSLWAVSFFPQFILKFLKKKINKRKKFELAGDSSYPSSSYRGSPVLLLPFPQEFHFLLEFITF